MPGGRRILVVSEIFWPEGGGAELATYLILRILRDANFKITVITSTEKPAVIKGVRFYYTGLLGNWSRVKRFLYISILSRSSWFIRLLQQHDILYIPLLAYPLIPLAKKYGLRVIVHLHNYVPVRYHGVKYFFEPDRISMLKELRLGIFHELHANNSLLRALALPVSYVVYQLSKIWLEQADTIICVSKRQAEIVKHQLPSIAKKIRVIYNPPPELPDVEKVINSNKRVILYVGGREYRKGYHMFLQITRKFTLAEYSTSVGVEFILTGKGFNKFLQFSIGNIEVRTMGYISREQLIELHKRAAALVFPSVWEEPLPYAIIESMLLKTIPIAPKAGGIPEIVSGTKVESFLVEPGSVDSFVNAVRKIISMDSSELLEIGEEMRYHVIKKLSDIRNKLLEVFT